MARKAATLSEKRGIAIVRGKGSMVVTRMLKAADAYWKEGRASPSGFPVTKRQREALSCAVEIYTTLLPFCLPKLQSVEFNSDLNLNLTAEQIRAIDNAYKESRKEFDVESSSIELPSPPREVIDKLGLNPPSAPVIVANPDVDNIMSTETENDFDITKED